MKRRNFIRNTFFAGLAIGPGVASANFERFFSEIPPETPPATYDMVAVKNGEPRQMLDKAMESLGGMKAYVKKGQKVVVKPNIGWDVVPERAGNTNPALVKRIVELSLAAGASEVFVFDNTCDKWSNCYKNSGIEKAVEEAGGKTVPGNTESYYKEVEIKKGKKLKKAKVHELILNSDVIINVPVLKHHSSADLSIAMKNLMGVVWDRMYWHRNDLHQCIADFATFCKPHLNIIDAYRVMMKNGPRGVSTNDVSLFKSLIVAADIVAADSAATKLFGSEPADIGYITMAEALGVGTSQLDSLTINRIKL